MMNRYAFLGLMTVGLVALMAPRLDGVEDETGAGAAALQAGPETGQKPVGEEWYSGGHALQRGANGHFFTDAYVDGAPVRFMVDTGA
ncbi:MAG: hypothetical protein KDD98_07480, partial [Sphingomonadaceae bacterium]|nr:hypothetical protein [Sphingomonadaceae bacterium]